MQTSSVCLRRQLPRRGKSGKGELRRQLPRRGSRERANCAERFYREENRERNERQPWRWKGQSGEKVGAAVGCRPLQSACADSFPEEGSRERSNCADSFPEEGSRERSNCVENFYSEENRERNERQPRRWNGQSREDRNDSAACGHKNR